MRTIRSMRSDELIALAPRGGRWPVRSLVRPAAPLQRDADLEHHPHRPTLPSLIAPRVSVNSNHFMVRTVSAARAMASSRGLPEVLVSSICLKPGFPG